MGYTTTLYRRQPGCDSIVETHLTVDNVIYSYDSLSICSGDSALIAGNYESTSGTYRDTLTAQAGCDSVAVLGLTIIPTLANTVDSIGICTGDSAMLAGVYETTSGVYYDTLRTSAGCDSIVETHLTVDNVIYVHDVIDLWWRQRLNSRQLRGVHQEHIETCVNRSGRL